MATVYPLSEGVYTIGHDKEFVPFDEEVHELNSRPVGSLLVEVQPFLVVTDNDIILFDTGLGFRSAMGTLRIHDNLAALGYAPGDVTKVLLSHLHKDHAGCVCYVNEHGAVQTTFPNATYYVYRQEAEFALQKGLPSYYPADIEPLLSSGQVQWLDGETGSIGDYITFRHSGGHCPYHIVYLVDDGTDKIFFGGDEAPQLKQMKIKYVAKYDYDGQKAMRLREQYGEEGRAAGWQFLFYH
ncbi:MAG: MBL fold metallo-hydrolase, partial [Chitinophagia bacterium]|nr:MBL fold metallo-hydrolase [Chitinophagia bacterium]